MINIAALLAGIVFGLGLNISRMIDPAKVQGFLDVAGPWDPSLAAVMAGALLTTAIGYRLLFRRAKPLFADRFHLPTRQDADGRLVGGAAIFGIGWGLAGFCPGPAIAALGGGVWQAALFTAAMAVGVVLSRFAVRPGQPGRRQATQGQSLKA